jgi:hypothetical protein
VVLAKALILTQPQSFRGRQHDDPGQIAPCGGDAGATPASAARHGIPPTIRGSWIAGSDPGCPTSGGDAVNSQAQGIAVGNTNGRAYWPAGAWISDRVLWFVVFLGGFVIIEPSPYELMLVVVIPLWAIMGLRISRFLLPLIVLSVLFLIGGIIAATQVTSMKDVPMFLLIGGFMLASSIWYAAIIAEQPERRLRVIKNAYLSSAVLVAVFGVIAYFEAFPGAETFKYGGRATSTFQDPNIFGPYLAVPIVLCVHNILTRPLRRSIWSMILFVPLALGLLLAFSRAAWGLTAFAIAVTAVIIFLTSATSAGRLRVIGYFTAFFMLLVGGLVTAISVPAIGKLFEQRAQLVQEYDGKHLGRFDRIVRGLNDVPEHPLGLGAFEFALQKYGEAEHNTYLKGFTAYGWIGGVSYLALSFWTLFAAFPLLFLKRPWQPLLHATYAVYIGHMMIAMVIDIDHWRHVFLIVGILWGVIAAEKARRRQRENGRDWRQVLSPGRLKEAYAS